MGIASQMQPQFNSYHSIDGSGAQHVAKLPTITAPWPHMEIKPYCPFQQIQQNPYSYL